MAYRRGEKGKSSPKFDQRLTEIESKIQTMENHISSQFKAMEDQMDSKFQAAIKHYMNDGKNNKKHSVPSDSEKKSKELALFPRKTKDGTEGDVVSKFPHPLQNSLIQKLLSMDFSTIATFLKNPIIQSWLADTMDTADNKKYNNGNKWRKRKKSTE